MPEANIDPDRKRRIAVDVVFYLGGASLAAGVCLVWGYPAALIVAGVLLLAVAAVGTAWMRKDAAPAKQVGDSLRKG